MVDFQGFLNSIFAETDSSASYIIQVHSQCFLCRDCPILLNFIVVYQLKMMVRVVWSVMKFAGNFFYAHVFCTYNELSAYYYVDKHSVNYHTVELNITVIFTKSKCSQSGLLEKNYTLWSVYKGNMWWTLLYWQNKFFCNTNASHVETEF